jgi:hypothetical protein
MTEDTKSLVPIRYQQYGITVKLNPDKHDKIHATFGTLPKTYPTLWVCCVHHDCMTVYDVTSANDTQRNIHLTDHHTLGVKLVHSHQTLYRAPSGHIGGEECDYGQEAHVHRSLAPLESNTSSYPTGHVCAFSIPFSLVFQKRRKKNGIILPIFF